MRAKIISFPTVPKERRLVERAKILCKNFGDEVYGTTLMDLMLLEIYNQFKDQDDFYSEQVCAKVLEARAYLEFFQGDESDEVDDN